MKAIFVQDVFHYNHRSWIEGFLKSGWEVEIIVRSAGYQGEYDYENEFELSILSELIQRLPSSKVDGAHFNRKYTIPSFPKLLNYFRRQQPDVIITIRYTALSLSTLLIAELLNIPIVVYDQYPVYAEESWKRKTFRIGYSTLAKNSYTRISPVKGNSDSSDRIPHSHYVPFAIEAGRPRTEDTYFHNGDVSILFVGKFRQRRKRHLLFLKLINRLVDGHDVSATLVGAYGGKNEEYFESLQRYVRENSLNDIVQFKMNVPHSRMKELYRKHDLFVLPSKDEPAAYSPLEAMAESLPVICSDSNGTKCYIDESRNGFVFETDSLDDLTSKTRRLMEDRQMIIDMGQRSREMACQYHKPTNLENAVSKLI